MTEKEFQNIAPILSKIKKEKSFLVPDGYFDSVEDQVSLKLSLKKINEIGSKEIFDTPEGYFDTVETFVISKLNADNLRFELESDVPDGYFENIEDRVFETINAEKKKNTTINLKKYLLPFTIAASLLLLIVLNTGNEKVTFDSLATTDIEEFIDYELIDMDTQTLVNTYADLDIENTDINTYLSDENVLDYLDNEDLELLIYEN